QVGCEAGGPASPRNVGGCEAPNSRGSGGGDRWSGLDRQSDRIEPARPNHGDPGLFPRQPACAPDASNGVWRRECAGEPMGGSAAGGDVEGELGGGLGVDGSDTVPIAKQGQAKIIG